MSSSSESRQPDRGSPYSDAALAATCDRLALPHHFRAPAAALVRRARIASGARLLDLGCGTGAVTGPAQSAVGNAGRVYALDPSLEMLRLLRAKGVGELVVGRAPGLPFRDASFDVVLASFVLSHVTSYRDGLA